MRDNLKEAIEDVSKLEVKDPRASIDAQLLIFSKGLKGSST